MTIPVGVFMGLNFAAGFLSGVEQSNQYNLGAKAYQNQADISYKNAENIRTSGAMNEDAMRLSNRSYLANAYTALSEAGMSESPTMVSALAFNAASLEQNVLQARYQTESEAENYLYQAKVARINAKKLRKKAGNAFSRGLINGISSAFSISNF